MKYLLLMSFGFLAAACIGAYGIKYCLMFGLMFVLSAIGGGLPIAIFVLKKWV